MASRLLDLVVAISYRTKELLIGPTTCHGSSPAAPWSELPADLLALVMASLADPADRARFSSVCRSWRHAASSYPPSTALAEMDGLSMRRPWYSVSSPLQLSPFHGILRALRLAKSTVPASSPWRRILRTILCPRRQQPWIAVYDGFFLDDIALVFSSCGPDPITSFPDNLTCVGSTDSWLALDYSFPFAGKKKRRRRRTSSHAYLLHNPFSRATVALPRLDAVLDDNVSDSFLIRKVLMRSDDGLVVLLTNNRNLPIIFIQPGGRVVHPRKWGPAGADPLLVALIDIAFLGDRLYGITMAEGLVSFRFIFDDDHLLAEVTYQWVIQSNVIDGGGDDDDHYYTLLGDEDEENDENDDNIDDEVLSQEDDGGGKEHRAFIKLMDETGGDGLVGDDVQIEDEFIIFRYLVADPSSGKLLMVWRQVRTAGSTGKVEVFQADVSARAWTPVLSKGLGGRALFISQRFSKSVVARRELEPDAIYFADFGEVFHMKPSQSGSSMGYFLLGDCPGYRCQPTWIFPPN